MEPRRWTDLTTEEQDEVVHLYYYAIMENGDNQARPMTVSAIVRKFYLNAEPGNFTTFLPCLVSEHPCEGCTKPMEFLVLSQSDFKTLGLSRLAMGSANDSSQYFYSSFPGLTYQLPYKRDRFRPCRHCGHNTMATYSNCPCLMCGRKRKEASIARQLGYAAENKRRAEQEAARHQALINKRIEVERCASELPESPLPDEVKLAAELLIRSRAKVEEDGGLWITIGWSGALPEELRDPWSDRVMDSWTVLAHLQIRGLIRRVMPYEYTPEPQVMLGELDRYLVTCGPDRARELKLISPTMAVEWRAARSKAQPQSA
jgi:hypothetical protein